LKNGTTHTKVIEKFLLNEDAWWVPRPGAQLLAYFHPADEIYFGGKAGTGKTDIILGLASNEHKRSLILRRIYPQLEAMVFRSQEIFNHIAVYNSAKNYWLFNYRKAGIKRFLQFGAVQYDKDKFNYQGRPFDFIAFDEITQFLFSQFTYIKGWNRSVDPDQRCRIICTGNPPTDQDGAWVIDYWAPWLDRRHEKPAEPGEIRYFIMKGIQSVMVDGPDPIEVDWAPEPIFPHSRTFIPGEMLPELVESGYRTKLMGLPEPLRSQLLYGDMEILQQDNIWQIIPTEWVMIAMERWRNLSVPKVVNDQGKTVNMPMDYAGVDVARGGGANTVIAPRHGNYIAELVKFPGKETPDGPAVAGQVIKVVEKNTIIIIDVIGVGSSPFDYLSDYGYNIIGFNSAEGSDGMDRTGQLRFKNLRAEAWWNAREMLDPDSGEEIALPDGRTLLRELTTPKWKPTPSGIQVESKEDLMKPDRLGHSPDEADAVVQCLHGRPRLGIIG
jgi:hypothetical protein